MITAERAREISSRNEDKDMGVILDLINQSAENEEYSVFIDANLLNNTKKRILRSLGYEVTQGWIRSTPNKIGKERISWY